MKAKVCDLLFSAAKTKTYSRKLVSLPSLWPRIMYSPPYQAVFIVRLINAYSIPPKEVLKNDNHSYPQGLGSNKMPLDPCVSLFHFRKQSKKKLFFSSVLRITAFSNRFFKNE